MEDIENKVLRCQNSMPETFKDASRYLRAVRFWCTKGFALEPKLKNYIKEHARGDIRNQRASSFAHEIKNLVKEEHSLKLVDILKIMIHLDILPFNNLNVHKYYAHDMRKFLFNVEKKVERMVEGCPGMRHKVSKGDLRLLIFLGIITRKQNRLRRRRSESQGRDISSKFKKSFFENARWLIKNSTLNKLKDGVLRENRCQNFRLAWKMMFGERDFRANFGELRNG